MAGPGSVLRGGERSGVSRMFERALWSSRLLVVAVVAGVVFALGAFWIALGRRQLGQVVERNVGARRIPAGSRRAQVFSEPPLSRTASPRARMSCPATRAAGRLKGLRTSQRAAGPRPKPRSRPSRLAPGRYQPAPTGPPAGRSTDGARRQRRPPPAC